MLVFSRKVGEELVLPNHGVTIGVVAVAGGRVRLGIAAPPEVPVHRKEVWHRIRASRGGGSDRAAANGEPLRVLIADADQALSLSYAVALERSGFDVDVAIASNGLRCVDQLRKCRPHVLVLDPSILWGGGDGVLALMREESEVPAVPVLVHQSPGNGEASEDLDFPVCARACKPLPPEKMVSMIWQLANGRRARQRKSTETESDADWQHELRRKIAARTHGHVLGLDIEVVDGRLVVHGRSRSYYGKQLACAAALELMKTLDSPRFTEVELDIAILGGR